MRTEQRTLEELTAEALKLSEEERFILSQRLLESLSAPIDGELSPAWVAEIERRWQGIEDGTAKTIPADEVFAAAFRRLDEKNRSKNSE